MIDVFFYGLFMDEGLLLQKGLSPANPRKGYADGFGLRIGERATLIPASDEKAYGVVMQLKQEEATDLYSEKSVADYIPEILQVTLEDNSLIPATCYNLLAEQLSGSNRNYAKSLYIVVERLGFPRDYLEHIRRLGKL